MPAKKLFTKEYLPCSCFVCGKVFNLEEDEQTLWFHLYFQHKVIIDNESLVADLREYLNYYQEKLQKAGSTEALFKTQIKDNNQEPFFVLGKSVPGDEQLRKQLHQKKLEEVKIQQEIDFSSTVYKKHCFFCHNVILTTRAEFIDHLWSHGFRLGHPTNLVYIEKLVNAIQDLFTNGFCLYCSQKFEEVNELLTHMNANKHYGINPENKYFDQFYIINYMEYGKTWKDFAYKKLNGSYKLNSEDLLPTVKSIFCLFCDHCCHTWEGVLLHMAVSHDFDFKDKVQRLTFYEQVKLLNFINDKITSLECIVCQRKFNTKENLLKHMESDDHFDIPDKALWDRQEYYCTTENNDCILYHLRNSDISYPSSPPLRSNNENINRNSFTPQYSDSGIEDCNSPS